MSCYAFFPALVFIFLFFSDFTVRDNAAHYSIIRYNDEIDTRTQVHCDHHVILLFIKAKNIKEQKLLTTIR